MNIPRLIIPGQSVTVSLPGKTLSARADHKNFDAIIKWFVDNESVFSPDPAPLEKLFDLVSGIREYVSRSRKIAVNHGVVTFNGRPLSNYTTDKILQFMDLGLPLGPICAFAERLQANPSRRAVEQLYKFLEHGSMPLTDNGFFRSYKGVSNDYYSKHGNLETPVNRGLVTSNGRILHSVSEVIRIDRNSVSDDPNNACGPGLHAGSLSYATDWAGRDGRVMVVEIDPADVVSIPLDCSCQKLRCCGYVVVDELKDRQPLSDSYVKTNAGDWNDDPECGDVESCPNCGADDDDDDECFECGHEYNNDSVV